jgi:hypothetical protein
MDRTWQIVVAVIAAVLALAALIVFARELPAMRRYLRIKRM